MKTNLERIPPFFRIFIVAIGSWILVHIFAVLGVFVSVAYPIWWLFAPNQSVCFLCRAGRDGNFCQFCRQKIVKSVSTAPANFTSAILNGVIILLFSVLSFGVVFGEGKILTFFGFPETKRTVSFIIPSKSQYRLGEIFPMKIEITGVETPINTVQTDLSFDHQKLEVVNVSTEESFASVFVQREINNTDGYLRLTGGVPNPGYSEDRGKFGTVYFKAKEPGVTKVEYLPTSIILANDGRGTNVLKGLTSASYLILPEKVSPAEAKEQVEKISNDVVLGTNSEKTQMTFYEDDEILGTKVPPDEKDSVTTVNTDERSPSTLSLVANLLSKIDAVIISLWENFFRLFK